MFRFLLLFAAGVAHVCAIGWDEETDLDRYVHFDDGFFAYEEILVHRYENLSTTVYIFNMTSQKWLDDSQVSKSLWWHMVGLAIPDEVVDLERAWIFTEGGSNRVDMDPPDFNDPFNVLGATLASNVGMMGGYVLNNPNAPIVFADDPTQRSRSEDRLIAWTWRSYLNNPDPNIDIVARLPMTKTQKRGMDLFTAVAKEKVPGSNIQKFIVTGASKRGWTALSVAAVDQRVEMCLPIVFTLLNMQENMVKHNQAMNGNWSWALEPYYDEDITKEVFNPKTQDIFEVEDMLYYKERLTMPKIFILATGDEFFFPQDLITYWDELPDPKYIMMNPNAQHVLFPHYVRILETIQGAILSLMRGEPMPDITWKREISSGGAAVEMFTSPQPEQVRCLRAETMDSERKDFRLIQGFPEQSLQPVWWNNTDFAETGAGQYRCEETNLDDGRWSAIFMEAMWRGPENFRMFLTTQVQPTPDTYPAEPCTGPEDCYGLLS